MSRETIVLNGVSGVGVNVYNDEGVCVCLADPSPACSAAPTLRYNFTLALWPLIAIRTITTMTNKPVDVVVDEKMSDAEFKEVAPEPHLITPQQIQARFATLRDLNTEQMTALNKKLVSRLDWRLMPCITLMFLMK
jgi:hypothetical protein